MRKMLLRLLSVLGCAATAGACNAVFGIGPLDVYESPAPDDQTEAQAPEACNGSLNLEGCVCETLSAVRDCYHGDPSSEQCKVAGRQTCLPADSTQRWGPCEGGGMPVPEACYDQVDNSCDGKADENCPCSLDVDLCNHPLEGGALPSEDKYNFFTIPSQPKAGEPFELFVVTKLSVKEPTIWVNNACYGAGSNESCASPGAGCSGWNVIRFELHKNAGKNVIKLMINDDPNPPCDEPVVAEYTVTTIP